LVETACSASAGSCNETFSLEYSKELRERKTETAASTNSSGDCAVAADLVDVEKACAASERLTVSSLFREILPEKTDCGLCLPEEWRRWLVKRLSGPIADCIAVMAVLL
jgi:hypothetical protein